jgi:uncharacterized membrane protein YgdD (TMEM256/DUF423 family)
MQKIFLIISAVLGSLGVIIGAMGAHRLKQVITDPKKLEVFETGVRYHFYHTFALIAVGVLMFKIQNKLMDYSGWCFILGIILFSGSLYFYTITGKIWGPMTPIGGFFFITGWILMAIGIAKGL